MDQALYHGGRARVAVGGLIEPGRRPNNWGDTFDERGRSVYVYCTTDLSTAESYAQACGGGRVYEVEPTGDLLPDYNGSDFKSRKPLKVIARVG
jgi:hypothetical protein